MSTKAKKPARELIPVKVLSSAIKEGITPPNGVVILTGGIHDLPSLQRGEYFIAPNITPGGLPCSGFLIARWNGNKPVVIGTNYYLRWAVWRIRTRIRKELLTP